MPDSHMKLPIDTDTLIGDDKETFAGRAPVKPILEVSSDSLSVVHTGSGMLVTTTVGR